MTAGSAEEVKISRALGDPTRWGLFQEIGRRGRATVADLTAWSGLHHNAVRQHLCRLMDAGLAREEAPRRALKPGRPPRRYALTAEGQALVRNENPLLPVVRVLLALLRPDADVEAAAAEAGRALGGEAPARRKGALLALYVHLEQTCCQPVVTRRGKAGFEMVLGRCPFRDAAHLNAEVLCRVHAGLLRGFLEALPARCRLESLTPENPETAGCRARVSAAPVE